jgi:SAM-dependent methyltransferase
MAEAGFDFDGIFNEDYLYFYETFLTDEQSDRDATLITRLLDLRPGERVLDLPCGHGRIANRLAAAGYVVTGLDASELFLSRAREDAARRGTGVGYVHGDMRAIPWSAEFDVLINWFTSFGYFSDEENRNVLSQMRRALRPGGRLLMEINHRDAVLKGLVPWFVHERDGNLMIDGNRFDPLTGRTENTRTIVRDGRVRTARFGVRMFTFPELRDWLLQSGFASAEAFGEDGEPLAMQHRRMIVRAAV